jgi:hypothetical protein
MDMILLTEIRMYAVFKEVPRPQGLYIFTMKHKTIQLRL